MADGGFDAVIGNPPYLKIENIPVHEREYFESTANYTTTMRRFDAFGLFLERSAKTLLKQGGVFGMIVPSVLLNNFSFSKLRKFLLDSVTISTIVNLGGNIFRHVNNDTLILIFSKTKAATSETHVFNLPRGLRLSENTISEVGYVNLQNASEPDYSFELYVTQPINAILTKMTSVGEPLETICNMFQGLVTGSNPAYIVTPEQVAFEQLEESLCKPIVFGDDIPRYGTPNPRYLVIYLDGSSDIISYPHISERLRPFRRTLMQKREVKLKRQPWWSLHWPREALNFQRKPKILVQCIRNPSLKRRIIATLDNRGCYADHALTVMYPKNEAYDLRYILGILNSNLVNFYFLRKYVGDVNIKGDYLRHVPIRKINSTNPQDVELRDKLIALVDDLLAVHRQIEASTVPDETTRLERQRDAVDKEIDRLVYALYGLTTEETTSVES
jgi:hypothetical protein